MKGKITWIISLLSCAIVNCIPRVRPNDHYIDGKHNIEHDHQAFLDENERNAFKTLTPEQSRVRLG